jgi:hypothetical protein
MLSSGECLKVAHRFLREGRKKRCNFVETDCKSKLLKIFIWVLDVVAMFVYGWGNVQTLSYLP